MEVKLSNFTLSSNWVRGNVVGTDYRFEAKIYDEDSEDYGINGGRVSKLFIYSQQEYERTNYYMVSVLISYDREWDVKPTPELMPIYHTVMKFLETSPKRGKRIGA